MYVETEAQRCNNFPKTTQGPSELGAKAAERPDLLKDSLFLELFQPLRIFYFPCNSCV